MATLKPVLPQAAAPGPGAGAPRRAYPRWSQPGRLRRRQLARGWRATLSPGERRLKRALDVALCLVFAAPIAVVVGAAALAVRLESAGSPWFTQLRVGENGRGFRMWKLRTMVENAEAMEKELAHLNELPWPDFKISRDPRITRVGRWLRRSSIDELPQVWNVLRGEMSLVGPRPTNFGLKSYQLWHTERLATPPGITGLWQVLERAACDFDQRLRLDLAYVRNWSLGLELAILWATVAAVASGRGAK